MTDHWKKKETMNLANCKSYIKSLERDLVAAKKREEELTKQLSCEHDWYDTGSGMQLDIAICRICGATDAA